MLDMGRIEIGGMPRPYEAPTDKSGGSLDKDVRSNPWWTEVERRTLEQKELLISGLKDTISQRVEKYRDGPRGFGKILDEKGQTFLRLTGNGRFVDDWLRSRKEGDEEEEQERKVRRAYGRMERLAVEKGWVEEREDRKGLLEGEVKCAYCGGAISGLLDEGERCMRCSGEIKGGTANFVDVDFSEARRYVSEDRVRAYTSAEVRALAREANAIAGRDTAEERFSELKKVRESLSLSLRGRAGLQFVDLETTLYRAERDNQRLLGEKKIGGEGIKRIEIPTEERELRLFLRAYVTEVIRVTGSSDALTLEAVMKSVSSKLGFDPKTFRPVDLFPQELGERRSEVRDLVEGEIRARCQLRLAEIQEDGYANMEDKNAAIKRYIGEMKGSDLGGAGAVTLSRETYLWLKGLEDVGDGLTREKVDKAFQALVLLGENPEGDPFTDELGALNQFLRRQDRQGKINNFYDSTYPPELRAEVFKIMRERLGDDAVTLAEQIFKAFKERGNYDKNHYLYRLFNFGQFRHSLTKFNPPLFTGSRRLYMQEDTETFSDEYYIENGERKRRDYRDLPKVLALSPLRVRGKTRMIQIDGEWKDERQPGLYLARAMEGKFLAETAFEDPSTVKKMPQTESYSTIKDGDELREKIGEFGKLGKENDTGSVIGTVIGLLAEVRSKGISMMVEGATSEGSGIFTREELDRFIVMLARDVFWEMGVDNDVTTIGLDRQRIDKPSFLIPSQLRELYGRLSGVVSETGIRIIENDRECEELGTYVYGLMERTIKILSSRRMKSSGDVDADSELVKHERRSVSPLVLIRENGPVGGFTDRLGKKIWGRYWKS